MGFGSTITSQPLISESSMSIPVDTAAPETPIVSSPVGRNALEERPENNNVRAFRVVYGVESPAADADVSSRWSIDVWADRALDAVTAVQYCAQQPIQIVGAIELGTRR